MFPHAKEKGMAAVLRMLPWVAAVAVAWPFAGAVAADYPSRPIRIVVSGAPGGAADLIGRPVAAQIEKQTGWSLVIDNRAGANAPRTRSPKARLREAAQVAPN
jgi:tripartite-type tricarboxylate transporter receptor subunit TctC